MFAAITADPDDINYKPVNHPDRIAYDQIVEVMEPTDEAELAS